MNEQFIIDLIVDNVGSVGKIGDVISHPFVLYAIMVVVFMIAVFVVIANA